MNINDFRKYIDYSDYTMGKYLVDKGHAKITESDSDGYFEFDVNGYKVNIRIFPDGELDEISCDCSQDYGYCYHIAAALIVLLPVYEKSISSDSSYSTSSLINFFDNSAEHDAQVVNQPDSKINIEPVVHFDGNELGYSLKIGFDKLYSVKNVLNLYEAFQAEETVSYGKNLTFRHSYDLLDEHCEKLLEFSYNVCIENKNSHYTYDKKILKLSGNKITQFFEIMEDTGVYLTRSIMTSFIKTLFSGSTKASMRLKMVKEFNSDNTSVFLISLKAGGTGLNLTGADVVIHYDPWWNLSAENQASDRAYRIGQKNNVQIYKMITHHTIEEKIREMQQSKSQLADIALGGDNENSNIMHMSKDDILKLLE